MTATPETADNTEAPTEDDGETIEVFGATARRQRSVASTTMSLVVGTGELSAGPRVLVPYIEIEVETTFGDDESQTETIARTLSIDNAAFLLEELATGLAELIEPVRSMAQGELKMPPDRVAYSLECVSNAIAELAKVEKTLRDMPTANQNAQAENRA